MALAIFSGKAWACLAGATLAQRGLPESCTYQVRLESQQPPEPVHLALTKEPKSQSWQLIEASAVVLRQGPDQ